MDTSSPRKRTRIDPSVSTTLRALELEQAAPPAPPPRSHLENLPVELLSEVLSYMPTPNDLLNVTRASRYLCLTLLNKGNLHIWVSARKNCVTGEVPEPPPGWSEPAHAALIFDGGHCEVRIQMFLLLSVSHLRSRNAVIIPRGCLCRSPWRPAFVATYVFFLSMNHGC